MNPQPPINLNIPLEQTIPVVCESCQSDVFINALMLRKASRFVTGTSQDTIIQIPVFMCRKCGHLNQEFISPQLKNTENKEASL
jgi:hypothetical protein